jgi:tRNA threonylcarbamoyladenosine biosynthesis protein TsaE
MELTNNIISPACISLIGELGSGKTVFVKGIAKALGINEIIQSPSFVLMQSYEGKMKLYHIDLYRIKTYKEVIPLEEYFLIDGITAIEWADRAIDILPDKRIEVNMEIISRNERKVTINDYRN